MQPKKKEEMGGKKIEMKGHGKRHVDLKKIGTDATTECETGKVNRPTINASASNYSSSAEKRLKTSKTVANQQSANRHGVERLETAMLTGTYHKK
jgi:hypothetical protein